jgi:hypothetical protein
MVAAAYTLPVDRQRDWLEELERIVKRFDAMSSAVQVAVLSACESVLDDLDITEAERTHLIALLARRKPRRFRAV